MTDAAKPAAKERASAGRQLKRLGTLLALALVAGLGALLVYRLTTQESARGFVNRIAAGDKPVAPGFSLKPLSGGGGPVKLSSFRGKAVVVNFWASWCAPCKKEAPLLQQANERWRDRGVVFVGIDGGDLSSDARAFLAKHDVDYLNLSDHPEESVGHWGVTGFPETFFIDARGRAVAHAKGELDRDELASGIRKALG